MTMNLFWQPVPQFGEDLSDKLKFAMRRSSSGPVDVVLNSSSTAWLSGLRDAGIKDAQKLIDAIDKHGEIRVYEE